MKNKTKKILAGLGLGLVGACALTGCSSDIVFNQADLDKAISGINEYLETQNNYSSEFARNMLNDAITKAVFKAFSVSNYTITTTQTARDTVGNVSPDEVRTIKVFHDDNTNITKQHVTESTGDDDESNVYREIKYTENPVVSGSTASSSGSTATSGSTESSEGTISSLAQLARYSSKVFNLLTNTYYETAPELSSYEYSQLWEVTEKGTYNINSISTLSETLNDILLMINSEEVVGDIVMDKIDDSTYDFYFTRNEVDSDYDYQSFETYQLRFVNYELTYVNSCATVTYGNQSYMISGDGTIDWNTTDFMVDTSNCITKIDDPTQTNE